MERSLKRGGRRDSFLGTREFVANVEAIDERTYQNTKSYYDGQMLNFGNQFQSFRYPETSGESLKSYFAPYVMKDGVIQWEPQEECPIVNTLSNYTFRYSGQLKNVDQEWAEIEEQSRGESL